MKPAGAGSLMLSVILMGNEMAAPAGKTQELAIG